VVGALRRLPAERARAARAPAPGSRRRSGTDESDPRGRARRARAAGCGDGRSRRGARGGPGGGRLAMALAPHAADRARRRHVRARAGRARAQRLPRARLGPGATGDAAVPAARRAAPDRARALLRHAGLGPSVRLDLPRVRARDPGHRRLRRTFCPDGTQADGGPAAAGAPRRTAVSARTPRRSPAAS
jgi:hypothetical protein